MPSSSEKRLEQQRARRAKAAATRVAIDFQDAPIASATTSCDKLTLACLPETGTGCIMHADLDELVTSTDMGAQEQLWRGGVRRQEQPDAHEHQVAASRAAAKKRSAEAAPPAERAAKRNAARREKREREAVVAEVLNELLDELEEIEREEIQELEGEIAVVLDEVIDEVINVWMIDEQPTRKRLNKWLRRGGEDTVDDAEFDAFTNYLYDRYLQYGELEPEDYERDAFLELFDVWRMSSEYEQWHANEEADQWSSWEGESVVSHDQTYVEDMYQCCDDAGEPEDPDDPYGGADLGYDNVDQMRNEFDREFGPSCHVRAMLRPRQGMVKLALNVEWEYGKGRDWDDYIDAVYADMEATEYPFLSSPTQYVKTLKELPPPPRRIHFDLGEEGRVAYHKARGGWYQKRTGHLLTGTIAQQEELYDNACRYQRARGQNECAS